MYISSLRDEILEDKQTLKMDYIDRKTLISLLYNSVGKVKDITAEKFKKILIKYENLKVIFDIVKEFKQILFGKDSSKLNEWIEKCKALNLSELNSFITGITRDIEAVNNATLYEYSNGLAEGKVNKIKVIKRIMLGRCSFSTLRNKILKLENKS